MVTKNYITETIVINVSTVFTCTTKEEAKQVRDFLVSKGIKHEVLMDSLMDSNGNASFKIIVNHSDLKKK